ncbi:MAG TPA: hypothetical protein VK745_20020 [Polyangiaceae bacterium]|nr:hypothetical protein [Polyangiaceae bacterium]
MHDRDLAVEDENYVPSPVARIENQLVSDESALVGLRAKIHEQRSIEVGKKRMPSESFGANG